MISTLITFRYIYGNLIMDLLATIIDKDLIGRFKLGLDTNPTTSGESVVLFSAMSVAIIFAVAAFIFVFVLALHIPLPPQICDREKIQIFEFLIRLFNEYVGDLIEVLVGPKMKNYFSRFIVGFPYNFKAKCPKWCKIENRLIDGVRCRIYYPDATMKRSNGLLVFIHGGGWCLMHPKYYDGPLFYLMSKTGITICSIDYDLAPEVQFPKPINDCEKVVKKIYEEEHTSLQIDPTKIHIMGDSAGGNLSTVTCQRLHRAGLGHYIQSQILVYPVTNVTDFHSPSYQYYEKMYKGAGLLNPTVFARMVLLYLGIEANKKNVKILTKNRHIPNEIRNSKEYQSVTDHSILPPAFRPKELYDPPTLPSPDPNISAIFAKYAMNPDLNPIFGKDLEGLPEAMIVTAGVDILRDEGILYGKKLESHKVPVAWYHYEAAFHGILNMPKSNQRKRIMEDIAGFINERSGCKKC
jgi:acetyl esterase/lipase